MSFNGASPFPAARISPGDQRHFEDLADQMLDRTLRSYDQFLLDRQQPLDDRKRWKEIRRETNAAVYVKRASSQEDSLSSANAAWRGLRDPMVIVGLGRSTGTVEDMLLALGGADVRHGIISAAYMGRRILDCATLAQLVRPTANDPFRRLVIQWLAYPAPPILDKVVRTRDYVFLLSKGSMRRANGDVIGYEMMQSVDLPEFPSLQRERSYIRGRVILGSIYVQRPDNSVDVFFETFVESNGRLSNKIARYYTSTALASLFRLDEIAKCIKLQWCVDEERRTKALSHHGRQPLAIHRLSAGDGNDCANCAEGFTAAASTQTMQCVLCHSRICEHCRRFVDIKDMDSRLQVTTERVEVCATCLLRTEGLRAADVVLEWNRAETLRESPVSVELEGFQLPPDDASMSLCGSLVDSRGNTSSACSQEPR